jgi:RNA 2',3'-cyclic 3'-phosphodiesterase
MRLFISIDVPNMLYRYCRQLQGQFPDMKNADGFHMTIQFLGDECKSAGPIIDALKKIKFAPFEIEMGNALPFPNTLEPRGVWIECKLTPELKKLAEDIQNAMRIIGYAPDKPFKAHITLGRYKYPPKQKIKEVKGEPHRFDVKEFSLVKSILTPKGPVHKKLEVFKRS